jgi:hypothetical protein
MSPTAGERLLDWLALSSARCRPDPTELTAAEWDELLAHACGHRVAPQLFRRLVAAAASQPVPRGVLQCLWLLVADQRQDTERAQRELTAALRALRAAGITPALLKGTHLASIVYPEPLLRPMGDFDLLIRAAELTAAEQALCAIGYTSLRTESMEEACASQLHPPPLIRKGRYPIELHWTLANPSDGVAVDLDGLWSRAQPATVYGEPALVLAPEDALLHVCLHAAILHLFDHGLRPLLDVVALLDRHGASLDWATVADRSRAWGVKRSVYLLLELARQDGGAAVPESVLARLQPEGVPAAVIDAARARLLELPGELPGFGSTRTLAAAWVEPRAVWGSVFCSQTALRLQYGLTENTRHVWRYYILRMKDLIVRYGGVAWQLVRGDRTLRAAASGRMNRDIVLRGWLERGHT